MINDCICIENNIKTFNDINEKMNNHNNSQEIKIKFFPENENEIDVLEKY